MSVWEELVNQSWKQQFINVVFENFFQHKPLNLELFKDKVCI